MKFGKKRTGISENGKKRRDNSLLTAFLISLIVAAAVYIAAINIETSILSNYEKLNAYVCTKEIIKGTPITADTWENYFTIKEIDKSILPDSIVNKQEDVIGKAIYFTLKPGTVITNEMFYKISDTYKEFKNPREISLSVEDIAYSVGGTLRAGDKVDIYITNTRAQLNGESVLTPICQNAYILSTFDDYGTVIQNDDKITPCRMISIIVEESTTTEIYNAIQGGKIYFSKIIEEDLATK